MSISGRDHGALAAGPNGRAATVARNSGRTMSRRHRKVVAPVTIGRKPRPDQGAIVHGLPPQGLVLIVGCHDSDPGAVG